MGVEMSATEIGMREGGKVCEPASGYSANPNPFGRPVSLSYISRKERTLPALLNISTICSSARPKVCEFSLHFTFWEGGQLP